LRQRIAKPLGLHNGCQCLEILTIDSRVTECAEPGRLFRNSGHCVSTIVSFIRDLVAIVEC
jgi:hypothetical protein